MGRLLRSRIVGWAAFICWAIVGIALAISFIGMASIGLLVLPVALLLVWLASRYGAAGAELLGRLAGAGAVCLAVGFANLDFAGSCAETGTSRVSDEVEDCGGINPVAWLVVGTVLAIGGAVVFALIRRRPDNK